MEITAAFLRPLFLTAIANNDEQELSQLLKDLKALPMKNERAAIVARDELHSLYQDIQWLRGCEARSFALAGLGQVDNDLTTQQLTFRTLRARKVRAEREAARY